MDGSLTTGLGTALRFFDLSKNNIAEITADAFIDLPCLETLLLKGNALSGVFTYATLPQNLEVLDLSYNGIAVFKHSTPTAETATGGGSSSSSSSANADDAAVANDDSTNGWNDLNSSTAMPSTGLLKLTKLDLSHNKLHLRLDDDSPSPGGGNDDGGDANGAGGDGDGGSGGDGSSSSSSTGVGSAALVAVDTSLSSLALLKWLAVNDNLIAAVRPGMFPDGLETLRLYVSVSVCPCTCMCLVPLSVSVV